MYDGLIESLNEFTNGIFESDPRIMAVFEAIFDFLAAGGILLIVVVGVITLLVSLVTTWVLFLKAGEDGWKAIIPFYNFYTQIKLTWKPIFFWIALGALVAAVALKVASGGDSQSTLYSVGILAEAVAAIIVLMDYFWLSKSFGHGEGYFVGLIFLPWIFAPILAFGKSEYVGNAGVKGDIRGRSIFGN